MQNDLLTNSQKLADNSANLRIVVVGASAGGLSALPELVSQLPDAPLAVFIVLHLSQKGLGDFLVHRLQGFTTYNCRLAKHEEPILPRTIYLASPDRHLLLGADGHVLVGGGPIENRWRPSIDVLFRSAAAAYGPLVVGIILTGLLNDGVSGMLAIQKSGGITIVQDPTEAEYPDMPVAVLDNMDVDYCLPMAEMGAYLAVISEGPLPEPVVVPPEVLLEAQISQNVAIGIEYPRALGDKSLLSCPDCGGGLWEITENKLHRYRCHVGHSYTEEDLVLKQQQGEEATLWVALRMMEERCILLEKMADQYRKRGLARLSASYDEKVEAIKIHISRLKEILFAVQKT